MRFYKMFSLVHAARLDSNHTRHLRSDRFDRDRLPGWNFLLFKKAPVPGISQAFVERDKSPIQITPQKILESYARLYHPNSVKTYLGAIIQITDQAQRQAFDSISQAQARGACSYLPDGTWIHWLTSASPLAQHFKDKVQPIRALTVGVRAMDEFNRTAKPDATIDFYGRPAAQVCLAKEAWDILALPVRSLDDQAPPEAVCPQP